MQLQARHITFAQGVAAGLKHAPAAILAGVSETAAAEMGMRWSRKPSIRAEIERQRSRLAKIAGIDRNWLLEKWVELANADVNELIQYRVNCCRHCHGLNFDYQWTEKGYEVALEDWERKCAAAALDPKAKQPDPPDVRGGFGYHPDNPPNPDCPMCFGRGTQEIIIGDTRKLSKGAALLYQGVKQTNSGLEVKIADKIDALNKIGEFLGVKGPSTVINTMAVAGAQAAATAIPDDATAKTLDRATLRAIAASGISSNVLSTASDPEMPTAEHNPL